MPPHPKHRGGLWPCLLALAGLLWAHGGILLPAQSAQQPLKNLTATELTDLYYMGVPMQAPIRTKMETWDAQGCKTQERHWDLHGAFLKSCHYAYDDQHQLRRKSACNELGDTVEVWNYRYAATHAVEQVQHFQNGSLIETATYLQDDQGRISLETWSKPSDTEPRHIAHTYEGTKELVVEYGGDPARPSHQWRYDKGLLMEEYKYSYSVRLDRHRHILPGADRHLDLARRYAYDGHGGPTQIWQKTTISRKWEPIILWGSSYDDQGRAIHRTGSYKGIPQCQIIFQYQLHPEP